MNFLKINFKMITNFRIKIVRFKMYRKNNKLIKILKNIKKIVKLTNS